jgi:hypothetical protein
MKIRHALLVAAIAAAAACSRTPTEPQAQHPRAPRLDASSDSTQRGGESLGSGYRAP